MGAKYTQIATDNIEAKVLDHIEKVKQDLKLTQQMMVKTKQTQCKGR